METQKYSEPSDMKRVQTKTDYRLFDIVSYPIQPYEFRSSML